MSHRIQVTHLSVGVTLNKTSGFDWVDYEGGYEMLPRRTEQISRSDENFLEVVG